MTSSRNLGTLAVLGLIAVGLWLAPHSAEAQETPYGSANMSNYNPHPGDAMEMTVMGCNPGATITYSIDGVTSEQMSTVADDAGSVTIPFTIPEDLAPRRYLTLAQCPDPEHPDFLMGMPSYFDVVAAEPPPETPAPDDSGSGTTASSLAGTLPRTGPGNWVLLAAGLSLVAVGTLVSSMARLTKS